MTLATPPVSKVEELGPWFHNLHLPDGTQKCSDHWLGDFPSPKWRQLAPHLPLDMRGMTVLDIGCNAGFYTIELAKRGGNVLGIDVDNRYLRQARWTAEQFDIEDRAQFRQMQVYDLAHLDELHDIKKDLNPEKVVEEINHAEQRISGGSDRPGGGAP